MKPKFEFCIGSGKGIRNVVDSGLVGATRTFIILDNTGVLQVVKFNCAELLVDMEKMGGEDFIPTKSLTNILEEIETARMNGEVTNLVSSKVLSDYHAGAVTGVDTSPISHIAVTCGVDGSVR